MLQQALAKLSLHSPLIPVINNVDVQAPSDPAAIVDALVRQAWHPVRWVEVIQAMKARGVTHIVECGPGKVLAGMIKRIDPDMQAFAVTDPDSMRSAIEAVSQAA